MIKNKSEMLSSTLDIDLSGPDGNALVLMRYAKSFCEHRGTDSKPIIEEMISGDYENLVNVFDREFGDFVTLYR